MSKVIRDKNNLINALIKIKNSEASFYKNSYLFKSQKLPWIFIKKIISVCMVLQKSFIYKKYFNSHPSIEDREKSLENF